MQHFSADKTYALFLNAANRKIISELEVIGAKTIMFPTLETRAVEREETEDLSSFLKTSDWLIFTDIYTVEFFLQKLEEEDFDFYELDEIRVCAYGESVADRLRFVQVHADIIPNSIKTAEVARAIRDYFLDEDELKAAKFLVFKEKTANPAISNELENTGATVFELPIYEIIAGNEAETARLKSLLVGGAIDEFIFTSPFDIINLAHLFPTENLEDVTKETRLAASNKTVLQSLEEFRVLS